MRERIENGSESRLIRNFRPLHIDASSISDAWFQLLYNIFDFGYTQEIQRGSFANEEKRIQYPSISVFIEHPEQDMIPIIPAHLNIPSPTTKEYIESYCANYLLSDKLAQNETYTYGSRICTKMPNGGDTQLERIVSILKETPQTNQAVIEIATPVDLDICKDSQGHIDPPCLRLIDFKVIDGVLTMSVYFRSWDLWAGFPTNLGGLELMKEIVASETGLKNGPLYAYSAGAHIYGYSEEIARIRTNRLL